MNSFINEVYAFTKQIDKSELKKDYDKVKESFCIDGGEKSIYNQISVARGHQFLSFFIAESYKDEAFKKLKMNIPNLSESEKNTFLKCHNLLLYIDKFLCKELLVKFPHLEEVLNPYSNILLKVKNTDIDDIIQKFDFSQIEETFKNLPEYEYIYNYNELDMNKIKSNEFTEFYFLLKKELSEIEIKKEISNETQFIVHQINNNGNKGLIKFMFSVSSLRFILDNLNQLIYQKFEQEQLYAIDENKLIDYKEYKNLLGSGIIALIQPGIMDFMNEPGDLIIFSLPGKKSRLFKIESYTITIDKEQGQTCKYKIRNVDNNLNPIYNLFY